MMRIYDLVPFLGIVLY